MKLKVHVVYWGAWGYAPKYQKLARDLDKEFPGKLDISGQGTPTVTGWFEVSVGGKLIHSKKNGDGYLDTSAKLQKVKDAIRAALGWFSGKSWRKLLDGNLKISPGVWRTMSKGKFIMVWMVTVESLNGH